MVGWLFGMDSLVFNCRFNATKMLEMIRGKRLVFVGDSLNRNQWESMLCLLASAVKDPKKVYETHGRRITKEKGNYSFKFVVNNIYLQVYPTWQLFILFLVKPIILFLGWVSYLVLVLIYMQDYKCTVEYYVTHFLVHESKARVGQKRVQTLRIDSVDRGSSRWRAADILVFNSAHWWSHYKTKAGLVLFKL